MPRVSTMRAKSQPPEEQDGVASTLNAAIEVLNLAKDVSSATPAKAVFGVVSVILAMIRDAMINEMDYVELGLACAEVCAALDRGTRGKKLSDLNDSACEAINQLTTAVAAIQKRIIKQSKRNAISRHLHAKNDKEKIAAWRSDLVRILHVFNTELAINTHVAVSGIELNVTNTQTMVSDIHRTIVKGQEGNGSQNIPTNTPGETPPPPPRTFFGRDGLVEKIVSFAESLVPIALIGAGGIGKTSVALTVLHHGHIKERFGHNRRFIRCDQFPPSSAHLLRRLSDVIGAGVENPKDLASLRTFLSSKEMFIVLDNAESTLDPRGTDAQGIYTVVEELSRFSNICICITSRLSTPPPDSKRLAVPTLSINAARDTFYGIYDSSDRPDVVDGILERLDFHPLSITLLATVAHQNQWDVNRLAREWEQRRTSVLQTQHNRSLATAIELSLSSPLFQDLGPSARGLLGVVAFFPQGIDENNLDWLFSTISNRAEIFDKFCILSLTHRSNGFVTMLAPLRDYLTPKDPKSSPLLRATTERYFTRILADVDPNEPSFGETQWIISEDINVEHLLDVFTTVDPSSDVVWEACTKFMTHLCWHKRRLTILGPKIEGLPDNHNSKPECLLELAQLFDVVGNRMECKRFLTHTLELWRERGSGYQVAHTLRFLSDANRLVGLREEGIQQAKEALEIYEHLDDVVAQAWCLVDLAFLLHDDGRLDAAEEAASHAISLIPEKGEQFLVCESYRAIGVIYQFKGETNKAVHHFEIALGIASTSNWHGLLFWLYCSLAELSCAEGRFDEAHARIESAKSHATNSVYNLSLAMELEARVWHEQRRLEEARSEALRAADAYEKLGSAADVKDCREFLKRIEEEMNVPVSSG